MIRPRFWPLVVAFGCSSQPVTPVTEHADAAAPAPAPATVVPTSTVDEAMEASIREASAGVSDARLGSLLEKAWRWGLARYPERATRLGVHTYDDRLSDQSLAAEESDKAARRERLAEASAIDPAPLNPDDRLTLQLFREDLEASIATEVCEFSHWNVTARGGAVGAMNRIPDYHRVTDRRDADNLIARYRQLGPAIDHRIAKLRAGAAQGKFGNAESTRRAIEITARQLKIPLEKWKLIEPALEERADWSAEDQARFRDAVEKEVRETVKPAVERYLALLEQEIVGNARDEAHSGLGALPGGAQCYEALIRSYTTLSLSADEIHNIGLQEIDRINAQMRKLGKKLFGTRNLKKILTRLRTDKSLYFETSEQVETFARDALAAAKAKMPAYFGRLPQAECIVVPIPELDAPYTTIAYYNGPFPDGSKPGEYFINTYAPTTRPRYEARVLAYHESIPGHHLQIAISKELSAVPAFRKHGGRTVFVEGWALYTERLSDEMGLYVDDLDRMGVLSFDAWRAGRLVVDTGLHAKGWSREQAEKYLLEHTALAANNINNEVDRYISTPGQALAYKIGQLEILKLRGEAESALGPAFDIREFHDVVLGAGAVPLSVLRQRVMAYIAAHKE